MKPFSDLRGPSHAPPAGPTRCCSRGNSPSLKKFRDIAVKVDLAGANQTGERLGKGERSFAINTCLLRINADKVVLRKAFKGLRAHSGVGWVAAQVWRRLEGSLLYPSGVFGVG